MMLDCILDSAKRNAIQLDLKQSLFTLISIMIKAVEDSRASLLNRLPDNATATVQILQCSH